MTEQERVEQDMHWPTHRNKESDWKNENGAKGKERSVHTQRETLNTDKGRRAEQLQMPLPL